MLNRQGKTEPDVREYTFEIKAEVIPWRMQGKLKTTHFVTEKEIKHRQVSYNLTVFCMGRMWKYILKDTTFQIARGQTW